MPIDKDKTIPPQYQSIQPPKENLDDGLTPVTYIDYTPENSKLTIKDPENFMLTFKRKLSPSSVIISGHNTSIYNQLNELGKNLMNGPYKLSGRDNKLVLHNSKANKKTVHSYVWAGGDGELLEFELECEYSTSVVEASKSADIDPDDKSLVTDVVQTVSNTNAMYDEGRIKWFNRMSEAAKGIKMPSDNTRVNPGVKPLPFLVASDPDTKEPLWKQRSKEAYDNTESATKDIGENYQISEYDSSQYWENLQKKFESIKDPQTEGDLNTMLRNLNELDPYIIKKKVYIKTQLNPLSFTKSSVRPSSEVYGYSQMKSPQQARDELAKKWKKGYKHLLEDPTITIIPKVEGRDFGGYRQGTDIIEVIQEKEVTIPVPGIRVLASTHFKNANFVMANDLINLTKSSIKATAKALGKPSLEEGMNIEIKNVGSRYSGVWHITSIEHIIDDQGYTCDMEFTQKVLPIAKNIISSKVNTQKIFAEINKVAKESLKTKAYSATSEISKAFLEWRKDHGEPDAQYLLVQDKKNPRKATVYKAGSDFVPGKLVNIDINKPVANIDLPEDDLEDEEL